MLVFNKLLTKVSFYNKQHWHILITSHLTPQCNHHHWTFTNERIKLFQSPSREEWQASDHFFVNPHLEAQKKQDRVRHRAENHQGSVYSKESGGCNLCQEEKTSVMFADEKDSSEQKVRNHAEVTGKTTCGSNWHFFFKAKSTNATLISSITFIENISISKWYRK